MNENHLPQKKQSQSPRDGSNPISEKTNELLLQSGWIWVTPICWMILMRFFSSDSMNGESTSRFLEPFLHWAFPLWNDWQLQQGHYLVRKTAHIVEYAILTGLWVRAFFLRFRAEMTFLKGSRLRKSAGFILLSACISTIYASLDEYLQTFTRYRTGNPGDVLFDFLGVMFMGVLLFLFQMFKKKQKSEF